MVMVMHVRRSGVTQKSEIGPDIGRIVFELSRSLGRRRGAEQPLAKQLGDQLRSRSDCLNNPFEHVDRYGCTSATVSREWDNAWGASLSATTCAVIVWAGSRV